MFARCSNTPAQHTLALLLRLSSCCSDFRFRKTIHNRDGEKKGDNSTTTTNVETMGDNNEQEAADLDTMSDDDDNGENLFEVRYRGGRLDNIYNEENPRPLGVPDYSFPTDVNIRLIIDQSVTEIDKYACYECTELFEVIIHPDVTDIGRRAFYECRYLHRVELPTAGHLRRLEHSAFSNCTSLQQIVIPASVLFIGGYVFGGCTSFESVVFSPRITSVELGDRMFRGCSDLRFVSLPHNLRSIPANFFYGCTSLTHLQIPKSVEEIGALAFAYSGIQAMNSSAGDDFMPGTIILPPNLQSISDCRFMNCKSLAHIRIPASVQWIGEEALNGPDLRSIEIPETVHRIGREALRDCSSLQEVTFHSSTTLLMDNDILAHCPLLSVIKIAPWLWPTLFSSMNGHPEFIFKFFRQYHTKIFDFNDWWVNRNVNQS